VRHVEKRLTEPVLLILASLAADSRHGYALIKDIESFTGVRLSTGTLFGAIRRLLEDRWIEPFDLADTSRDKQSYRLTAEGRRQLRSEVSRLEKLTEAVARRL
jgi:DNA-binding PadR family transcriptional regulator